MRAYLPIILVLLAIFTAGCIAYIAWELSSEESGDAAGSSAEAEEDSN